jgi:hypothetical protein
VPLSQCALRILQVLEGFALLGEGLDEGSDVVSQAVGDLELPSLLFQHCAAKVVVATRQRRITYK